MAKAKRAKAKAKAGKAAGMTREEFWAEVARIGWGTKTTDCGAVKIELMRKGKAFCDALSEHFEAVDVEIYVRTDMGGCDGADDCRRHIVGLGKAEFDAVMEEPWLAEKRYKKGDYRESFAYCLPHEHDFADLDEGRYTRWAREEADGLHENIDALWKADSKLASDVERLIDFLHLVIEGDLAAGAEAAEEADGLAQGIARKWGALVEGLGGRLEWREWGVRNLFKDLRKRAAVLA